MAELNITGGLGVFVNTYVHTMDPKKRLTIPSDWRELVGEPKRVFVLPGINEPCLTVFPARELALRMESIRKLSIADKKGRGLARTLASKSDLVPWDAQGRIRVNDDLLQHAGLTGEVVLVGNFDGFELWSPENWKKFNEDPDRPSLSDAAEYVGI